MSKLESFKNILSIWIEFIVNSISIEEFYANIDNFILNTENPNYLLIELSELQSKSALILSDFIEKKILDKDEIDSNNMIFNQVVELFRRNKISIEQVLEALQYFFIDEEYGTFDCPNEKINNLYIEWEQSHLAEWDSSFNNKLHSLILAS